MDADSKSHYQYTSPEIHRWNKVPKDETCEAFTELLVVPMHFHDGQMAGQSLTFPNVISRFDARQLHVMQFASLKYTRLLIRALGLISTFINYSLNVFSSNLYTHYIIARLGPSMCHPNIHFCRPYQPRDDLAETTEMPS